MDSGFNRRDLLKSSFLLPLCAATGIEPLGVSACAQTPIKRVGGPKLKISLNAYSFSKALNDYNKGRGPGMTLFDLLEFCAKNNFDAVDPTGYFFPGYPAVPSDSFINQFKLRAFHLGLGISGTGVRNNFASPDKEARAADVRHVKEWIEVAAKMGAPVIRVFAGPEPEDHPWDEVAAWMVEDLKECVEVGKEYGVIVGIQNHWDFLKTSAQVIKIVKMVDSEWFGVIVDTGYFWQSTYDDIAAVIPYAVNWQIKEKLLGKESDVYVDMKKLIGIIRDGGYRGYIPIETLSVPGEGYDPKVRVAELLQKVRDAL